MFFGDQAKCSECHGGFNFTDYGFYNNGLYLEYVDVGRFRVSGDSTDIGKFKVPTLRNVELTGPYMHDGSLGMLENVLAHYAGGGFAHENRDGRIAEIQLSSQDQEDLIAFLKTLTDYGFVR